MAKFPKWFRPGAPPLKPEKPVEPQLLIQQEQSQPIDIFKCTTVGELKAALSVHADDVKLDMSDECDCGGLRTIGAIYHVTVENPFHKNALSYYKEDLKKWTENMVLWERHSKEWPALKAAWDAEAVKKLDMKIARLKAQKAELEGQKRLR